MAVVLAALSLLGLGIFGPGIANGIVSGGPQLGAGSAIGTGLVAGGAAMAAGGAAGLALRGGASAISGGAAAVRGSATAAGAASAAYSLGSLGQSGAAGVASGLGGGARAAGGAAASARVQARNWRLMAFGCLILSAGFAAALIWQSARGTIVPWVVQVDNLGQAQAVAPAQADYRPTDPQVAWHLARFIEQVRSIPADAIIVRQNWLRAYEFPRRFALSPRWIVWDLAEVHAWLLARRAKPMHRAQHPDVTKRKSRPVKARDRVQPQA